MLPHNKKSRLLESNQRPVDSHKKQLQSNALPTELSEKKALAEV